jgi:hypothetical protein
VAGRSGSPAVQSQIKFVGTLPGKSFLIKKFLTINRLIGLITFLRKKGKASYKI